MDISNNYLRTIASNHYLYSANDTKETLSATNQGADTAVQHTNDGVSANARFLNKPILSVMGGQNKLTHLLKTGQATALRAELSAIKARATLVSREVASRMDVLRSSGAPKMAASVPLPADQRTPVGPAINMSLFLQNLGLLSPDVQLDGAEQQNSLFDSLKNATAGGTGPSSSWDICESVADAIGGMGSDYLDIFQQAVEKYAEFYRDFSDFISKLKDYMQASSMGGDGITILKGDKFLADLQKLIDKYTSGNNAKLYPANGGGASKEESEAWCREMGFDPEKCLRRLSDGSYEVRIDTSPLQEIYDSVTLNFPYTITEGSIGLGMLCNSAQWAAWQAGLDMQKDNIQTGMQTLTQKYSNANSTYDNLVKVLSSTITSLLDCDKGFLNI
ncbi:IpaD/SipD/SspD family type III secretion system needle tip protein [Cedecea davisae]|uniref:IpaD/SipD/SspD family type III secretion system needle tip protein n=1 Tax=Cedecea davisae TaxID=158484 RepID=A0ABS6DBC6_9ENTR|nr:IpaD/SipD/SspD family type III secretion system needle tip protein [Cedecea davisae]MBU4680528.1 IpaD/SipD/SspD family type III secretion system needle tip protein [Cedecea davisae]MBU4685020.1 IpaD/SipD/SspD family type III secretion system needle tip protein [Cedecea davisae]